MVEMLSVDVVDIFAGGVSSKVVIIEEVRERHTLRD